MPLKELILDTWSAFSHKGPLREWDPHQVRTITTGPIAAPGERRTWVPSRDQRRLIAYQIAAAYEANSARLLLDDPDAAQRREYGDAGLIIDTTLAAILGETIEVVVPGSENYDESLEQGVTDGDTQDDVDDADLAANAEAKVLAERQEFLREWADDVHFALRVTDCEHNAVAYGDGVYVVAWNPDTQRVDPMVLDPGFYFPVLPDTLDGYAYPDTVHFAWELPGEDFPDGEDRVRRVTYRLEDIDPESYDVATGEPVLHDGDRWQTVQPPTGTTQAAYRVIVRTYPWDTQPSQKTCTITDATWRLKDLSDPKVDVLSMEHAVYAEDTLGRVLDGFDLGIDFLPVVHVPNTPAGGHHYGQSTLARVSQALDDLQDTDTDGSAASSTTGSPIVAVSGTRVNGVDPTNPRGLAPRIADIMGRGNAVRFVVEGGAVWDLGENGKATVVDTSAGLAELGRRSETLRDRAFQNARLPSAILGTTKPSEVASGYQLRLTFGPLDAMVRKARLVRSVKYPLLLKMVARIYQANGVLEAGDNPYAEVQFGAYLPDDQAGTVTMVTEAVAAKVMSLETAIRMLMEVGVPIDDAAAEVERIEQRMYAEAGLLADATGDEAAARELLHLKPVEEGTGGGQADEARVAAEQAAAAAASAAAGGLPTDGGDQ